VEEEKKVLNYKFEGNKFELSVDSDKDGEPSVELVIMIDEVLQEAFKKGIAVEGKKAVEFDVSLGGLKMIADTDKDGEPSIELKVSLGEAISEVL